MIDEIKLKLAEMIAAILEADPNAIDEHTHFGEYGLESVTMTELADRINRAFGININPTFLYEHNTIASLCEALPQLNGPAITKTEPTGAAVPPGTIPDTEQDFRLHNLQEELIHLAAGIIGIPKEEFPVDDHFGELGYESVTLGELAEKISGAYGLELTPVRLYEKNTIKELARYLYSQIAGFPAHEAIKKGNSNEGKGHHQDRAAKPESAVSFPELEGEAGIAVIGMAGVFPQSEDLDEFWAHLFRGECLVGPVPQDREELTKWRNGLKAADPSAPEPQGGFMKAVDKFDPLFFNISPKEAELMDPQQRMFLETVWSALEEAGYSKSRLAGSNTGVFVGISSNDYTDIQINQGTAVNAFTATGKAYSILANRISYYFDWHGPSQAVDTACSSSLVALHYAIESIYRGECDLAVVGGVNVLLSPAFYQSFSDAGMLSPTGLCKTFDKDADGYVRGEGVAALVLKPLYAAIQDGAHIHGVIKASQINHGGHAHSLTAPNPDAQADLLQKTYQKAAIDPGTVGYIEAHGTGTKLGDPIEIEALKKAFGALYQAWGYEPSQAKHCGIGSVKTNIGHLEAAAGMAGVIKVLLAMKYARLPQIVNFNELNPYIELTETPFYIVTQTRNWETPRDRNGYETPRRAGVSSFGFGGANAHVVLEECREETRQGGEFARGDSPEAPELIILSARNRERLILYIKRMIAFIDKVMFRQAEVDAEPQAGAEWAPGNAGRLRLADLAFTLQTGREALEERLALVVTSLEELREAWQSFTQMRQGGPAPSFPCFYSNAPVNKETLNLFFDHEEGHEYIGKLFHHRKLDILAKLWVEGATIDWERLYGNERRRRISLPTYPFSRERYWIPSEANGHSPLQSPLHSPVYSFIHPLLHQNISDFFEQRYSSTFSGEEFFLADHQVRGRRVLPGVAFLEMARAAFTAAGGGFDSNPSGFVFKNIVWSKLLVVESEPVQVQIRLSPNENEETFFEIYTLSNTESHETTIHGQGTIARIADNLRSFLGKPADLSIGDLKNECNREQWSQEQCYQAVKAMGIDFGPSFRIIERIYRGQDKILARLALPSHLLDTWPHFFIHPGIVDGALQAQIGLLAGSGDEASLPTFVPFNLKELQIFQKPEPEMWAYLRYSEGSRAKEGIRTYDIDLCNAQGTVCLKFKSLSFVKTEESQPIESMLLHPAWTEETALPPSEVPEYTDHLVILCELGERHNRANAEIICPEIESRRPGARCFVLDSREERIEKRFTDYSIFIFETIQDLFRDGLGGKILFQILIPAQLEQRLLSGFSGLLMTAARENPAFTGQVIEIEIEESSKEPFKLAENLVEKLKINSRYRQTDIIRYQEGKRLIRHWVEWEDSSGKGFLPSIIPWKNKGVYLITGGSGGLGLIFAKEIVSHIKQVTLILTGRSSLSDDKQIKLNELMEQGARIEYHRCDVTDQKAVTGLIRSIRDKFGNPHGIIHSAGIIRDNFIIKKTSEELQEVLAPKVAGLVNLDQASQDLPLDFFILFSSIAGALGNTGQADYSAANAFMDAYAEYRNSLVASKQRYGLTLSINWPLWKEGGMQVDEETRKMMLENMGMTAIETATGIRAFYQSLSFGNGRVMVLEGDLSLIKRKLFLKKPSSIEENKRTSLVTEDLLREKAINYFKKLLSTVIKLPADRIEANAPMEKYGIDSIMVMQLTNQLEKTFGSLPKTLFFEYQNIQELIGYFLTSYRDQLIDILGIQEKEAAVATENLKDSITATEPVKLINSGRRSRFAPVRVESPEEKATGALDIAIIGVSGRYPGAKNIPEFWKNLRDGKDCITEIPKDRWDHSLYFDKDKNKPGKTYSKWGGFLDGVDKFDPLFFNISPREAEMMDPQERLFLECVYETIEDAGYTRETLALNRGLGLGGKVGVFVGVMYEEYQLYGAQGQLLGRPMAVAGSPASIANRVSYLYNFHGPSVALDTMCSSSLTAIHLACQSMQRGECEVAIAGGVNVSIHPNKYLYLAQGKFVSSKGWCESFGEGGDGYVPGEGVGAVLLKPLSKAIADGDQIYGIIKGTAVNHGGKTNGYTVPNPNAQAEVIGRALKEAGIDPRTVSYIEAHGTGTSLGDPIEIAGLNKAFQEYTKDKQFCAIGSAKSNIGHCESAAGIAGVTKVLLQLKNKQLVPSLHSKTLNPNIDFNNSPFIVQQELTEWKKPMVTINGETKEYSRIAGISSFGAGGANAHILIEEYLPKVPEKTKIIVTPQNPVMIVLSAKNQERLTEQAQRLLVTIQEPEFSSQNPADIAYTLQVGREAMDDRLGLMVSSIKELEEKLQDFIDGHDGITDLYRGQVKRNQETMAVFALDEDMAKTIDTWIVKGKYGKLLELWVKGLNFDWNKLYGETKPRRISLPTYPFVKERYWIPESNFSGINVRSVGGAVASFAIHPLLHQNTSDFYEQRFSSTFTGQEFFLADYVVKDQKVLPGVAYLEMARAAVAQATRVQEEDQLEIRLKNVVWTQTLVIGDQPAQVNLGLFPGNNEEITYKIYSDSRIDSSTNTQAEPIVYSQGSAVLSAVKKIPSLDLKALQIECSQSSLSSTKCYELFETMGFKYGPGHQGIEKVYIGNGQVLAKLSLPASVSETKDQFVLHPSLMDAALQASIGLMINTGDLKLSLPFALQELQIISKCASIMWALIRYSNGNTSTDKAQKLDIDLCDEQGNVCIRMKGFSSRVLEGELGSLELHSATDALGTLMLEPVWKEQAVPEGIPAPDYALHLMILCEPENISQESLETQMNGVARASRCLALQSNGKNMDERFQKYALQVFEEIRSILDKKPKENVLIQMITFIQPEKQLFTGLYGLLRTAQLENPKLITQLVEVAPGENAEEITEKLKESSRSPMHNRIQYQEGKRYVASWSEVNVSKDETGLPWRDGGIYLITGGTGGLGFIFAKEIARRAEDVTLILTGRSKPNENIQLKLGELKALDARVDYKQVDVIQKKMVTELVQNIRKEYGNLHGIIHSAGVIRDNYIIKKTKEELQEVLMPKVTGLVNLDQASQDLNLDFFILFSSITGSLGNPGQADYSTANAFMDAYANYRNTLVALEQRRGRTLSINWPLWKEGGMRVDDETEKMMTQNTGMIAMQTQTGIQALYQSIASEKSQVMVIEGKIARMKQKLLSKMTPEITQPKEVTKTSDSTTGLDASSLLDNVQSALIKAVSNILKVKIEDIDAHTGLNEYGFDSISLTQFANKLNEEYSFELTPAIFFEYSTINSLTKYLTEEYQAVFAPRFAVQTKVNTPVEDRAGQTIENDLEESASIQRNRPRLVRTMELSQLKRDINTEPIAIVGMSGIFPMARDLNEFWNNLLEGRDCITEIPQDRWDWREYFGDPTKDTNKTNIKWGGFIDGIDEFDPLFFGISPKEAELMDPQQRLIMIYIWKVIEDAGVSAQSLSGTKTAIFVGTGNSGYSGLISQANVAIEGYTATGMVPSVGPNRMSYFLNIHGPSEPIETACSSSLVAIHRAIEAMENGSCEMAIVGGVNTIVTPEIHISLNKAGMLSEDGRCKTFSDKANGYVRSEGVGMLFLKKLSAAERDGDHIYCVIRGTAENHGGRANSLTAPNPKAQAELLVTAYTKAGIDPRTVTYIEAHGTGTKLGDPIEINGLKTAFKELYQATGDPRIVNNHCGLGSVKTNIGHLELAAGIAGVIKVLLQLKHKTLVKSLHCDTINPYIELTDSPFYIVSETREWKVIQDANGQNLPRRAGVSSFGFGGVNAHIVVEEYIPKIQEQPQIVVSTRKPAIIVLSAKNEDRLKEHARQLLDAIVERQLAESSLADLAYTLQVGREAMEERLALIVSSMKEFEDKLKGFVEGQDSLTDLYRGQVKRNQETLAIFTADEDLQRAIDTWISKGKYAKLLDLWVKGLSFDWNKLYGAIKPRRISLPTYPFAKERYWIPVEANGHSPLQATILNPAMTQAAVTEEVPEIMTFEEIWQEQTLTSGALARIKTMLCFLSDPKRQQIITDTMESVDPETKMIYISKDDTFPKESSPVYRVSRNDFNTYLEVFRSIGADYREIDAVLYLWAFEEPGCIEDYSYIVYMLQAIAAVKLKTRRIILAAQFENGMERCYLESWIGFERSLKLVLPGTQLSVVCRDGGGREPAAMHDWIRRLRSELQAREAQSVLYQAGKRYTRQIRPAAIHSGENPMRQGGTYLITGGCGGLGLLFAEHLAGKSTAAWPVNLILTGRSSLDETKKLKIKALRESGCNVRYIQADVCDSIQMQACLNQAREHFGGITGVIHAAGILDHRNLFEKDLSSFENVLAPKIKGTIMLDTLLREEPLDFVCYFSSTAAILGDFGSCDYAVGNRFQTAFANYKNRQLLNGERRGKTFVINWPLWKDGGMNFDASESAAMYLKSSGQRLLEADEGFVVFDRILAQDRAQHLVLAGEPGRIYRFLGLTRDQSASPNIATATNGTPGRPRGRRAGMKGLDLIQCLEWDLKEQISQLLKISRDQLEREENLADFGFDSISLAQFATSLTIHYGFEITPALFFKYATIEKLAQYFAAEHHDAMQEFYRDDAPGDAFRSEEKLERMTVTPADRRPRLHGGSGFPLPAKDAISQSNTEPIAIIGMSGRFPQARNIDEMWQILVEGQDAIGDFPADRPYGKDTGKTQWRCGCIPGISEFDPLFFEISPREAMNMDPRQRLLLQESWRALEDAGYGATRIKTSKIGMFVGAEHGSYGEIARGDTSITSNNDGILAARLGYFLNFSGPVLAVNTACSSGLVAAHLACVSLRNRECDTAIAAGVNLMLTPTIFEAMNEAGMLSPDGTCYAFDKRANGMVSGEAVAVVVLKRLSQAKADGDPVYAVIRGSGINYDGKTNGITAPSGISQTSLLKTVYDQYQVNPEEIEYIVTHGTGTKLGDPVEINALYDAFKKYTGKQNYCALTSTKTNFGHSLAASGLVSLISLVQALRHEIIPASLHCEQENDYIVWKESPFYVNKTNKPWLKKDMKSRTGAVSAFGMSGTNAHMVIQSYDAEAENGFQGQAPYYLLALSAKTPEALSAKIKDLTAVLQNQDLPEQELARISYTLLEGRQYFEHRCAMVIRDREDAVYILQQAGGKEKLPNLFQGKVPRDFTGQTALRRYAEELLKQSQSLKENKPKYQEILCVLADLYCQGYEILWDLLFGDPTPRRIHLPGYPFAGEQYWAAESPVGATEAA